VEPKASVQYDESADILLLNIKDSSTIHQGRKVRACLAISVEQQSPTVSSIEIVSLNHDSESKTDRVSMSCNQSNIFIYANASGRAIPCEYIRVCDSYSCRLADIEEETVLEDVIEVTTSRALIENDAGSPLVHRAADGRLIVLGFVRGTVLQSESDPQKFKIVVTPSSTVAAFMASISADSEEEELEVNREFLHGQVFNQIFF
jgi:hypothetical protein